MTVNGLRVTSGANLYVESGATMSGTVIEHGFQQVDSGSHVVKTTISGGTQDNFGVVSGTIVVGLRSTQLVEQGRAVGTVLRDHGLQEVFTVASGTIVGSGCSLLDEGTTVGVIVSGGGGEHVGIQAKAVGTILKSGAGIIVEGGTVTKLTMASHSHVTFLSLSSEAGEHIAFHENTAKTGGTLTIGNAIGQHDSVLLFGQYVAAGFHLGPGSVVTYVQPTPALAALALLHR